MIYVNLGLQSGLDTSHHDFYSLQNRICYSPLYRLRIWITNYTFKWTITKGISYFLKPGLAHFGMSLKKTLDAYDSDEINETNYVNKLRRLAWHAPDIIDIHAHLAYAFALFMLQFWRMFIYSVIRMPLYSLIKY